MRSQRLREVKYHFRSHSAGKWMSQDLNLWQADLQVMLFPPHDSAGLKAVPHHGGEPPFHPNIPSTPVASGGLEIWSTTSGSLLVHEFHCMMGTLFAVPEEDNKSHSKSIVFVSVF